MSDLSTEERRELATQLSGELARELAKPEPLPALSLYQIEEQIAQLMEAREEAEAEGDAAAVAAMDAEIDRYAVASVRKVDGIAAYLRNCEAQAEVCEREAARLDDRAKRWRSRIEMVKAASLRAMQHHGVRVLETAQNKLRVQRNGGVEPLEITDELEPEFERITVTMPMTAWIRLVAGELPESGIVELERNAIMTPANDAIRAALKQGETVPGARLCARGEHLRVE